MFTSDNSEFALNVNRQQLILTIVSRFVITRKKSLGFYTLLFVLQWLKVRVYFARLPGRRTRIRWLNMKVIRLWYSAILSPPRIFIFWRFPRSTLKIRSAYRLSMYPCVRWISLIEQTAFLIVRLIPVIISVLEMKSQLIELIRKKSPGIVAETELSLGFHWPPFNSMNHLHMHGMAPVSNMRFIQRQIFKKDSFWYRQVRGRNISLKFDGPFHLFE